MALLYTGRLLTEAEVGVVEVADPTVHGEDRSIRVRCRIGHVAVETRCLDWPVDRVRARRW